jgi:hypothetical protein
VRTPAKVRHEAGAERVLAVARQDDSEQSQKKKGRMLRLIYLIGEILGKNLLELSGIAYKGVKYWHAWTMDMKMREFLAS